MKVNLRYDAKADKYLAVVAKSHEGRNGERYYMAYAPEGWVELSSKYLTRKTRSVSLSSTPLRAQTIRRALEFIMGEPIERVPRLLG